MSVEDPKALLSRLPAAPGVYKMLDEQGQTLYVGKARHLKKRVSSYFRRSGLAPRTRALMQRVADVEVAVTRTENEALLLENNLIKSLRPRYNILLRDDKSYPYILLSDHAFPRLAVHRGARREAGRYFGPYPSAHSVRQSLNLLQKLFNVRQCEDGFFKNRSRPCLQYQIKRCTAPCVGRIDPERYAEDVRHTRLFLEGRSQTVVEEMIQQMERAAERLDYESAARCRDRIAALRHVQRQQWVVGEGGDADVIAAATAAGEACVNLTFIRGGRNLGNKYFFPRAGEGAGTEELLAAFVSQYYLKKPAPPRILLSHRLPERELLERALSQQMQQPVRLSCPVRGQRRRWLELAELNAQQALARQRVNKENMAARFEALQDALGLEAMPERIECFDISHTRGEATVAACVVFDAAGPVKSDYRRFNIKDVAAGDDYGAMEQALRRRYRRLIEGEGRLPDLLLIDGGKGQLSATAGVLRELQLDGLLLVGVAKGPGRRPGLERLHLLPRNGPLILPADSSALHLIQQIRDEAHRFAITGHRQRRATRRNRSPLEQIPGIGHKRRQALLNNLGGLQEVARAGLEDLARVPGISPGLAKRIYDAFHE